MVTIINILYTLILTTILVSLIWGIYKIYTNKNIIKTYIQIKSSIDMDEYQKIKDELDIIIAIEYKLYMLNKLIDGTAIDDKELIVEEVSSAVMSTVSDFYVLKLSHIYNIKNKTDFAGLLYKLVSLHVLNDTTN